MSGTKRRKKSLRTLVKDEYFRIPRAEQVLYVDKRRLEMRIGLGKILPLLDDGPTPLRFRR